MNSNYAPICLFTYNRLYETKETVNALKNNLLSKDSELFIFSDGPKNESVKGKVKAVREFLKSVNGFKSITIFESKINNGLAKSIVDGVTQIINKYDKVIVLEDDIVTSKGFLKFMNSSLDFYQKNKNVFQISAFMFPIESDNLPDTFFYQANTCWGWATWSDRWNSYENDTLSILKKLKKNNINWRDFNSMQSKEFEKQLKANNKGKLETWAVKWHAVIKIKKGKVLHPKSSLVLNIGFGGDGENCKKSDFIGEVNNDLDLDVTQAVQYSNELAIKRLKKYFKKKYSIFSKIIRKIKSFF